MEKFSMENLTKEQNLIEVLVNKCKAAIRSKKEPIILFGAGTIGKYYLEILRKFINPIEILFCDNDNEKIGTFIEGIPVISFENMRKKYSNSMIIVTSLSYYCEMAEQLKENGLSQSLHGIIIDRDINYYQEFDNYFNVVDSNRDKFSKVYDLLCDEESKQLFYGRLNYCITFDYKYISPFKSQDIQYFDSKIIHLTEDEIFLDGGAFIGDTVEEFLKQTRGKFKKIYSFEPEKSKHKEFLNKFSEHKNIELVPYGLWNKKEILKFSSKNTSSSKINPTGNSEVPVISIDEFLNGNPVTFIKMDIEGAELEALRGAVKTIEKCKPKLAICIYHKAFDMVDIPLFLNEIVPEYKIYFRHYSNVASETVCYATI